MSVLGKRPLRVLAIVLLTACLFAGGALPRRAFFGWVIQDPTPQEARAAAIPVEGAARVTLVVPGGSAARAGVVVGDLVRSFGGRTFRDAGELRGRIRECYAGQKVELALIRSGQPVTLQVETLPAPQERGAGVQVEYTHFTSRGARLRAVMTAPADAGGKRLPALFICDGLVSTRLAATGDYSPARDLAFAAARAGFRALRFESRGFGDSEGQDYRDQSFSQESADNLAGLDHLRARRDVDPGRVFVFGHSTQGMQAPMLALQRPVRGVIVSGTVGRDYFHRMEETLRLQGALDGKAPEAGEETVQAYLKFSHAVAAGRTREQILAADPQATRFFNASHRIMDDRTLEYWREQLNLDMTRTWSRVEAPVLVLWGASDYLSMRACHEHILDVLRKAGNPDATLTVIPGMDHAHAQARDMATAHANYRQREFKGHPAATETILRWMGRRSAPMQSRGAKGHPGPLPREAP